jgi:hypothetical protein
MFLGEAKNSTFLCWLFFFSKFSFQYIIIQNIRKKNTKEKKLFTVNQSANSTKNISSCPQDPQISPKQLRCDYCVKLQDSWTTFYLHFNID